MSTSIAVDPATDTGFFGHPQGLFVCFATELWERFSFYGMKYLLLLYLTKYHLFSDANGLDVLGSYAALVYATPVIGGLLADRYLGMRKAVIFGGLLLVLGHLGMAVEGEQARQVGGEIVRDDGALQVFYFSLALIVVGVGFLKPNISTIVGRLYAEDDPRRDSGFTIFYMGINIGAFAATLLCGYLGETLGWAYGFGAAGIGMLLGLVTFVTGQKHLHGHAEPQDPALLKQKSALGLNREWTIYLGAAVGVAVIWQMLQVHAVVGLTLNLVSIAVLLGLAWFITTQCNPIERQRMIALIVLTLSTVVFWALFEQAAGSMTLFADRVMDRQIFGLQLTAAQYGSIDKIIIVLISLTASQMFMGGVVEPRLLGRSMNLSPFVVLISLTVWYALWGVGGAILAVPMTSVVVIILAEFQPTRPIAILLSQDGHIADSAVEVQKSKAKAV